MVLYDTDGYQSIQRFYVNVIDCTTYPVRTIVATVLNEGIYRTVDGGLNWTKVLDAPGNVPCTICADPFTYTHGERVVFSTLWTDGLWKSVNGGLTWHQVTSYTYDPYCIKFSKVVQGKLYVLGVSGGTVWISRSEDGGETWTHYDTTYTVIGAIRHRELAVTFNDQYVFYIVDAGANNELWRIDEDLTNPASVYTFPALAGGIVVTAQDDRVYTMTTTGVYVSEDWGSTWVQLHVTSGYRDLRVSKRDPRHIVILYSITGTYYTYVTYDGGDTWVQVFAVADGRVISIDRWDENLLYIGKTGGAGNQFMISPWNGRDAFARDTGLPAQQVMDLEVLE
jgi:hypothetical protein